MTLRVRVIHKRNMLFWSRQSWFLDYALSFLAEESGVIEFTVSEWLKTVMKQRQMYLLESRPLDDPR